MNTDAEVVRINKYLSRAGVCSRREADRLIEEKKVCINGSPAQKGDMVSPRDAVSVEGRILSGQNMPHRVVLAYYKPVGIVCSMKNQGGNKNCIKDAIDYPERVFPIGRLDKDSEGLLLLTNDGDYAEEVSRAGNNHEKEYIVTVREGVEEDFIEKMSQGVRIFFKDKSCYVTRRCFVQKIDRHSFSIVLTEGKNRQIRRMCESLCKNVTGLKRIRIMDIYLGNLKPGEYRLIEGK